MAIQVEVCSFEHEGGMIGKDLTQFNSDEWQAPIDQLEGRLPKIRTGRGKRSGKRPRPLRTYRSTRSLTAPEIPEIFPCLLLSSPTSFEKATEIMDQKT
jgi:hypothetical protein